jgi:hypothetical protein
MSSENRLHSLVRSSLFIAAVTATASAHIGSTSLFAQEANKAAKTYIRLDPQTKSEKEVTELKKKKDAALKAKVEKLDVASIAKYYEDYLIPKLTSVNPDNVNSARKEFIEDVSTIQASPAAAVKTYNEKLISLLGNIVVTKDQKVFAPETRINAAIVLGKLNTVASKDGKTITPEVLVQPMLLALIDPKEIDGLSSFALSSLSRHLAAEKLVSENTKKQFVTKLKAFLDAPVPYARTTEAHKYLVGQSIECLTALSLSEPDKEPSKDATEYLTKLIVKLFETEESEWLMETACVSLGMITPTALSEEEVGKLEYGIAKYARSSLREWKKRVSQSGAAGGGYGGGMGGYGSEGGGMPGGSSSAGYAGGSEGGGYGMSGGKQEKKTNVFEQQPKEVKNARRLAHQRFQRIHLALNGTYRKPEPKPGESPTAPTVISEAKGIIKLMADGPKKANIKKLIEKVEAFQVDLNDEKIHDLSTMTTILGKSMKGLREICVEIMGEDPTIIREDESKNLFSNQ